MWTSKWGKGGFAATVQERQQLEWVGGRGRLTTGRLWEWEGGLVQFPQGRIPYLFPRYGVTPSVIYCSSGSGRYWRILY